MAPPTPDIDAEPPNEGAEEGEQGLDLERVKELAGFFVRAPGRHPMLGAIAFGAVALLTLAAAVFWPRQYHCEVRLLAQRNVMLPAIDNPGLSVPAEANNPTKNVADTILQRDNVVALVKGVDLIDRWGSTRQPILRLKDRIMNALRGPVREEDQLRMFVGQLETQLGIATDESSITVSLDWPNAEIGYEIVTLVQKNFLDARYDADIKVVLEAIRILEERSKEQGALVDVALAEVTNLTTAHQRAPAPGSLPQAFPSSLPALPAPRAIPRVPAPLPVASAAVAVVPDGDAARQLEEVRRNIRDVEDDHRKRVAEARNQLAEAQTTLGPMHPTVAALSEKVGQMSAPPPELASLKATERALVARLAVGAQAAAVSTANVPTGAGGGFVGSSARTPIVASEPHNDRDDPTQALALAKLQAVSAKYNDLLARIEAAKIELDVARAAFKYQYTVVRPAELPRAAKSPKVPVILLAGLGAAILLSFLLAGGVDLARGRFVEPWQVQRALKLPMLGELTLPPGELPPPVA